MSDFDLKEDSLWLMQGDCLERMKEIPSGSVDMILTDLPYGTTACKWDSVIPFESLWEQYKRIIKDYRAIALFGKEPFSSHMRLSNISDFKYDWVWKKDTKSNFPQANFQPLNNIELISIFSNGYARNFPSSSPNLEKVMFYNPQMSIKEEYKLPNKSTTKGIFKENNKSGKFEHKRRDTRFRFPFNMLEFNTDKVRLHPTQKPVALLEYLIKTYTSENETILDSTMGSGSTGVACMNLNRNFIGIELDKGYFNTAKDRIISAKQNKQ